MIKMIVTDLDDTLLKGDKTISLRTLEMLKRCREQGIKVVYATARGETSKVIAPSEYFDGFVRVNGATAHVGDNLIYKRYIPVEKYRDMLVAADKAGIDAAVEKDGIHYANFDADEKWPWKIEFEVVDFNTLDIEAGKIFVLGEKSGVAELIRQSLPEGLYMRVTREGDVMIMHEGATKSKAVAALAAHWGIEQNEIAAFGDDTNDIDLLTYCGIGVAMGNAINEVKAVADFVCDTNENDGIAKWLEERIWTTKRAT